MTDPLAFDAVAITAVIGFTDRIRGYLPVRWQGASVLVSCALGVLYAIAARPGREDLPRNISSGVMIGLAASGGYSGAKGFIETVKRPPTA